MLQKNVYIYRTLLIKENLLFLKGRHNQTALTIKTYLPHLELADLSNKLYACEMNPETKYYTERIDHLKIAAGICQETGLIEEVDRQVGSSEQKVSSGKATHAVELSALGFSRRALCLIPDYLYSKSVGGLIEPGWGVLPGSSMNFEKLHDRKPLFAYRLWFIPSAKVFMTI